MAKHGRFWGATYDWRRPTMERYKQRVWNPDDPRMFTPKVWGWGWGWSINVYRLLHPRRRRRQSSRQSR